MHIYIQVKKLGKRLRTVGAVAYELEGCPATLRELIGRMVTDGVADYNRRLLRKEPSRVLTETEIQNMGQVGKIAFGLSYGEKKADIPKAVDTAILGFTDGLYRFFINEQEITELDAPLHLCEGDTVAILRLVMLTGGFF